MQELQEEREEAVPGAAPGQLIGVRPLLTVCKAMHWHRLSRELTFSGVLVEPGGPELRAHTGHANITFCSVPHDRLLPGRGGIIARRTECGKSHKRRYAIYRRRFLRTRRASSPRV